MELNEYIKYRIRITRGSIKLFLFGLIVIAIELISSETLFPRDETQISIAEMLQMSFQGKFNMTYIFVPITLIALLTFLNRVSALELVHLSVSNYCRYLRKVTTRLFLYQLTLVGVYFSIVLIYFAVTRDSVGNLSILALLFLVTSLYTYTFLIVCLTSIIRSKLAVFILVLLLVVTPSLVETAHNFSLFDGLIMMQDSLTAGAILLFLSKNVVMVVGLNVLLEMNLMKNDVVGV